LFYYFGYVYVVYYYTVIYEFEFVVIGTVAYLVRRSEAAAPAQLRCAKRQP